MFHENKTAWLDRKKTRRELAPARALHRAYDIVSDIEPRRPHTAVVNKNLGAKLLFVNGNRCLFTIQGQLRPTHRALSR